MARSIENIPGDGVWQCSRLLWREGNGRHRRPSTPGSLSCPLQPLEEQGPYLVEQAAEPLGGIEAVDEVGRELAGKVVEGARAQG